MTDISSAERIKAMVQAIQGTEDALVRINNNIRSLEKELDGFKAERDKVGAAFHRMMKLAKKKNLFGVAELLGLK